MYLYRTQHFLLTGLTLNSPSPGGEATLLGAGLAAVGEGADVGVAAVSTGAVPVWGDGREEEPVEAPPILFCRGERGLWAENGKRKLDMTYCKLPQLPHLALLPEIRGLGFKHVCMPYSYYKVLL